MMRRVLTAPEAVRFRLLLAVAVAVTMACGAGEEREAAATGPPVVAFLPSWFLTERAGQAIIRDHIRPRQLVAVHLPSSGFERTVASARRAFPGADAFTALLDKRRY